MEREGMHVVDAVMRYTVAVWASWNDDVDREGRNDPVCAQCMCVCATRVRLMQ